MAENSVALSRVLLFMLLAGVAAVLLLVVVQGTQESVPCQQVLDILTNVSTLTDLVQLRLQECPPCTCIVPPCDCIPCDACPICPEITPTPTASPKPCPAPRVRTRDTLYHHAVLPLIPPTTGLATAPDTWEAAGKALADSVGPRVLAYINGPQPRKDVPTRTNVCPSGLSPEAQLEFVLNRQVDGVVAYTVTDLAYVDMIDDFVAMMSRIGYKDNLFFGCLDEATLQQVCQAGYIGVLTEYKDMGLKQKVGAAKFKYTQQILEAGYSAFFLEMDVFMVANPKFIFDSEPGIDVFMPTQQDNPFAINIGLWFARPTTNAKILFSISTQQIEGNGELFDQGVINCFLKHPGFDPSIQVFHNCAPEHTLLPNAPTTAYHALNPHIITCHNVPFVFPETVGAHILTNVPLMDAEGKKMLAKELFLWEGANGYYEFPGKRYLAYDGVSSTALPGVYHNMQPMDSRVLLLVGIAFATNRTLILPTQFYWNKQFWAWYRTSPTALKKLIDFRETSFFQNPKVDLASIESITRLVLTRHAIGITRVPKFGEQQQSEWYAVSGSGVEHAMWGVFETHPAVQEANLLMVREDFVENGWTSRNFQSEHAIWLENLSSLMRWCPGPVENLSLLSECGPACVCI